MTNKGLKQVNEELLKNCEAYKGAWERCISQMKEDEKEKENFCKKMVLNIIDNLNSDTADSFIGLLNLIASYWRR